MTKYHRFDSLYKRNKMLCFLEVGGSGSRFWMEWLPLGEYPFALDGCLLVVLNLIVGLWAKAWGLCILSASVYRLQSKWIRIHSWPFFFNLVSSFCLFFPLVLIFCDRILLQAYLELTWYQAWPRIHMILLPLITSLRLFPNVVTSWVPVGYRIHFGSPKFNA